MDHKSEHEKESDDPDQKVKIIPIQNELSYKLTNLPEANTRAVVFGSRILMITAAKRYKLTT